MAKQYHVVQAMENGPGGTINEAIVALRKYVEERGAVDFSAGDPATAVQRMVGATSEYDLITIFVMCSWDGYPIGHNA